MYHRISPKALCRGARECGMPADVSDMPDVHVTARQVIASAEYTQSRGGYVGVAEGQDQNRYAERRRVLRATLQRNHGVTHRAERIQVTAAKNNNSMATRQWPREINTRLRYARSRAAAQILSFDTVNVHWASDAGHSRRY